MELFDLDLDYLLEVFQDDQSENLYYLDKDSGQIQLVRRDLDDLKDLTEEIELQRSRYLYIPKQSSEHIRKDIEHFKTMIDDSKVVLLLDLALDMPHKDEAVKKVLKSHPEILSQWLNFRADKVRTRVLEWLAINDLAP